RPGRRHRTGAGAGRPGPDHQARRRYWRLGRQAPANAKVLARAKEANIPVVTWDSDLLPADKGLRASYIGTVNEQVGIAVAKQAMALKPNGGAYCIQTGGPAA